MQLDFVKCGGQKISAKAEESNGVFEIFAKSDAYLLPGQTLFFSTGLHYNVLPGNAIHVSFTPCFKQEAAETKDFAVLNSFFAEPAIMMYNDTQECVRVRFGEKIAEIRMRILPAPQNVFPELLKTGIRLN